MTNNRLLLPAEWESRSAVLISWPHVGQDWAYMLDEVTECYINLAKALTQVAKLLIVCPKSEVSKVNNLMDTSVHADNYLILSTPTNDTWSRDFGMICVKDAQRTDDSARSQSSSDQQSQLWVANDYKFNGWGLKFPACHDNLITGSLFKFGVVNRLNCRYNNRLGFVLEGGSIDIDPEGVLLTTSQCLLSPNRNGDMTRQQIEQVLIDDLGCSKVVWLDNGWLAGDDTDSHVDTLARFLPGNIIAYTSCDRTDDIHYHELKRMEQELRQVTNYHGEPYQLLSLPIPEAIYDEDGQRLPATYANFLIVNGTVFLPTYADEHYDNLAIEKIKAALPHYDVVTVDCQALIKQHGSLHCATMQIPEEIISNIQ